MPFPIGKIISIATRALEVIPHAVAAVESVRQSGGGASGAEKKAAVLDLVATELEAAEVLVGHDLANDPDVLKAAGAVSDAVVAFHQVIANKVAGTGAAR